MIRDLFGNGEFSFADAHDEAYYRATRFESLYTFQVVFSLFCLAQELGVIAHHVVAHPADRSLILLLLPLLALSSATLAVRLALHHLWPKHSPARAAHLHRHADHLPLGDGAALQHGGEHGGGLRV